MQIGSSSSPMTELRPKVVVFDTEVSLKEMERILVAESHPRLVVVVRPRYRERNVRRRSDEEEDWNLIERLQRWAEDSVGIFSSYGIELERYTPLPRFASSRHSADARLIKRAVGVCANIFVPYRGNRSCFEVCREYL